MVSGSFSESDNRKGAIPEAEKTKKEIMSLRTEARKGLGRLEQNRKYDVYNFFRAKVLELHYEVTPHIKELDNSQKFNELSDIDDRDFKRKDEWDQITDSDIQFWKRMFRVLNKAIYRLGITNIALVKNDQAHGYEFLKGLDHNLAKKENPGWRRLKRNLDNVRRLLRKDTDMVWLIYGGNRTGKSTLSLQITRYVQKGEDEGDLDPSHFLFSDEDFVEAMESAENYDARHIDEMSLLFHKRDGMNTEQKDRNKMMKTYAKKNQFFIGCDNNFYNIDQEFISDKVDAVIHVPKRGRFEFYSKAKVAKFKKGADNTPETPQPDFKGRFPDLDPNNGQTDPLWESYKEVEDKKLDVKDDQDEHDVDYKSIAGEVLEDIEQYLKELEGRDPIVNDNLIYAEYQSQLSKEDAKVVKDIVESQVDLSNYS